MVMNDTVVFACGGGAYRVLAESPIGLDVPVFNMKSMPADTEDIGTTMVFREGDDPVGNIDSILRDTRLVFVFSMLGGMAATELPKVIMECARSCGCRVVQILGLPMRFEKDHRARAEEAMRELAGLSDATFLVDMESLMAFDDDNSFRVVLEYHAYALTFATRTLTAYARGPFFSTFPHKVYTIAFASGMSPEHVVSRAMKSMMFPTELDNGMMVMMVGKGTDPSRIEGLRDSVISVAGILPDIIRRSDDEDSKVLIFVPVGI